MEDCILLYRCWVIYDRRWMIVICPIIMCIAETGRDSATTDPSLFPFIITLGSLTLVINIIPTALIVFCIWTIHSAVRQLIPLTKNHPLRNTLVVLIESASIYTASVVIPLTVYALRSSAGYVVFDSIVKSSKLLSI
ncbi:uncharacterized protein BT62DRAFT_697551 [Guyanagaster necrorhizus]|uniref:Uncharacterized protein n=1 Tax=Guyanagaster necrorhizus TaxID=856835 RepID=A0A9P7VF73_9AGAR|nr:uncharacterized protein BT62DRAFT_697551 [Guyanagaster necrorhizus MCA 3950]KAG7439599.1 hypothetical protein BT62DRAFT_697551 [Guyanagaster necrorhizus MCA 3950]